MQGIQEVLLADIFISFIHEEKQIAEAVKAFLREKLEIQSDVFLASDMWAIYAGEDWLKKIKEELASAKVVLLMMSKEAVSRPWVNFEAGAAWLTDKVMIPVCFGGLHVGSLPKPYSNLQCVSLDDDHGPYYLTTSIHHHLKPNSLTPPPFTPHDPEVGRLRAALAPISSE
jgi:hypothetical protein